MKRFWCILMECIFVGILAGCGPSPTPNPPVPCAGPTITIGDVSENPNEVIDDNQPLANYLAERLASFGYKCGNVLVPDTTDKLIGLIKNGSVDIYMDSMYPAYLVSQATGAQPILRRQRNCDADYYSVIFTTTNSGITSIQDLPGNMIVMDRSYSTSGFALPAIFLLDHGIKLAVKDRFDAQVANDEVGIYFSGDDVNTISSILDGRVSAAATDDFYFNKWDQEAPGKLVRLGQTGSMPRQVVMLRAGLQSDLKAAIKEQLSICHLNPTCLKIIMNSADTCKFDDVPGGIEAAFAQMKAMHARLKVIPGWQQAYQAGK